MKITERVEGDRQRLEELLRREKSVRLHERYRAVLLALDEEEAPAIAAKLGRSRRAVQDWAYRYRDHGIEGIPPTPQPGQPPKLPREQEERLRARLDAGATEADGVCTLRGRNVMQILQREYGVKYTLNGVYCLLARLGYSSLAPRPRHQQADPQQQEAFRSSAPLLPADWLISSSPRAAACGSSSSTRLASARRGR